MSVSRLIAAYLPRFSVDVLAFAYVPMNSSRCWVIRLHDLDRPGKRSFVEIRLQTERPLLQHPHWLDCGDRGESPEEEADAAVMASVDRCKLLASGQFAHDVYLHGEPRPFTLMSGGCDRPTSVWRYWLPPQPIVQLSGQVAQRICDVWHVRRHLGRHPADPELERALRVIELQLGRELRARLTVPRGRWDRDEREFTLKHFAPLFRRRRRRSDNWLARTGQCVTKQLACCAAPRRL